MKVKQLQGLSRAQPERRNSLDLRSVTPSEQFCKPSGKLVMAKLDLGLLQTDFGSSTL